MLVDTHPDRSARRQTSARVNSLRTRAAARSGRDRDDDRRLAQPAALQPTGDLGPDVRQVLGEAGQALELQRVTDIPPPVVVPVLLAPGVVASGGLQVRVRVQRHPDIGPRRRHRQRFDPLPFPSRGDASVRRHVGPSPSATPALIARRVLVADVGEPGGLGHRGRIDRPDVTLPRARHSLAVSPGGASPVVFSHTRAAERRETTRAAPAAAPTPAAQASD